MSARTPILRLLRLARGSGRRMLLAALLGLLTVGAGIGLLATSAFLIARAALRPSIAELQVAVVGVRFFGIARAVFRYLERLVAHDVTFRLLARLRGWFYRSVEPLAPARLWRFRGGDLLARVVGDVETLEHVYVRLLGPTVVAAMTAAVLGVLLGAWDGRLAAAALAWYAAGGLLLPWAAHRAGRVTGRRIVEERAALEALLIEHVQGLPELLVYGRAAAHAREVRGRNEALLGLQRRMALITGAHEALVAVLASGAVASVLWLAAPRVASGAWSGILLGVFALAVLAAFEAIGPIPGAFQYLEQSRAAARRVFEIVDAPPPTPPPPGPPPGPAGTALALEGVRVAYPDADRPALDGLDLALDPGEAVALVGPSGAGKTTVANLLVRFIDPDAGRVRFGGVDLRALTTAGLTRRIGVVPQQPFVFAGTLRSNLALARPGAGPAEMTGALSRVGLGVFLERLPRGLDTEVGEQGVRMSGGERRRLALAQLLLRDVPVWVLDEPTADLDPLTERAVLDTLWSLRGPRTLLLITHRLVRLDRADRIVVLRDGVVAEQGTHAELLAADALYRRLFTRQEEARAVEAAR